MEYIAGGILSSRMGKPFSAAEAAAIVAPIARALNHAHQHKVIHRDIKPSNILINEVGQPLISDFGIVKVMDNLDTQSLTGTGMMVGTPAYMSPEQARARQVDERTDIYSLGVVYFELITGKKPFNANTAIEMTLKHINEPIPRPRQLIRDIPQEAEQIVFRAMAKNPDDRYPNALVMAEAFEKLCGKSFHTSKLTQQQKEEVNAIPAGKFNVEKLKLLFKNKRILGGLAAAVLVIVLGVFLIIRSGDNPALVQNAQITVTASAEAPTAAAAVEIATATPTDAPLPTDAPTAAASTVEPTAAATVQVLDDNRVQEKNMAQVVELSRIEKVSTYNLAVSPDDKEIIVGGAHKLTMIDPETMKATGNISLDESPRFLSISADNQKLYALFGKDIKVIDLGSKKIIKSLPIPGGINSIAISSDGKTLALGVVDNKMILMDADKGNILRTLKSNYGGWDVAFTPDSRLVSVGTSNGVLMWEAKTGLWRQINSGHTDLIKSIAFSQDGSQLAGGTQNAIYVWSTANGEEVKKLTGFYGTVNALDFSADGKIIIAGTDKNSILIWPLDSTTANEIKGPTSPVLAIKFSATNKYFVSGADEGVVRKWGLP